MSDLTVSLTLRAGQVVLDEVSSLPTERRELHTRTPHVSLLILLYNLWSPPVQAAHPCFPDICSTFPFCVAEKGSGKEKSAPPPTVATWQGRRAVGQEPAGHSRAYLWSAFSSLQSEALCSPAWVYTLLLSPHAVSRCLPHAPIQKLVTRTTGEDALSPHSLCLPPSSFPRLFILMGLTHEKGSPLCRNEREGSGHISRAVHRCPSHSGQNE